MLHLDGTGRLWFLLSSRPVTREALQIPVAFLVFNRPDTTARVFEAIRGARPRKLLLVADGPRPSRPGEAERCAEVRAIVDRVDWPCEVRRSFSDVNLGCGRRISTGLAWVFEQEERAIILEDDCLPHSDFFRFCEALLDRYSDDDRVMMIGGTNFLLDELNLAESFFFSRYFAIWGWATWRRAWARYDFTMSQWPTLRDSNQLEVFYRQPYMRERMTRLFDLVHRRELDTWDLQWFHACLFNNALSITPRRNLISNIGVEGTHHSGYDPLNHELPVFGLDSGELVGPALMFPERRYDDAMFARQFMKKRKSLGTKLAKAARRVFTGGASSKP